jgi:MtN3 and saliva related transmembrane protein
MDEAVGWLSSLILVVTISVQLLKQWRSGSSRGVSKWLFIGQVFASLGFVYYSVQMRNWVFVVTNSLLAIEAMIGLGMVVAQRGLRASHAPSLPPRGAGRVMQSP